LRPAGFSRYFRPAKVFYISNAAQDSRKYFAVCANKDNKLVYLSEADVSPITHDSSLFHKVWSEYEALRVFRMSGLRYLLSLCLIEPVDVKFIQVLLSPPISFVKPTIRYI
jgi:hypothetical protein